VKKNLGKENVLSRLNSQRGGRKKRITPMEQSGNWSSRGGGETNTFSSKKQKKDHLLRRGSYLERRELLGGKTPPDPREKGKKGGFLSKKGRWAFEKRPISSGILAVGGDCRHKRKGGDHVFLGGKERVLIRESLRIALLTKGRKAPRGSSKKTPGNFLKNQYFLT